MKPAGMLAYYAERFSTVEVNNTFYRMPTAKVVEGWAATVPPALLASCSRRRSGSLTSPGCATWTSPSALFCDTARLLGGKLGPLLFQLPPNFKVDAGRLADLLALLPPDVRAAFEFRNATWFTDEVYTRLAARNAALCIADNDDGATPAVATADWGYLRLRATGYSDDDLRGWLATMRRVGERWRDAFVFFKHEDAGTGPALGARLGELIAGGGETMTRTFSRWGRSPRCSPSRPAPSAPTRCARASSPTCRLSSRPARAITCITRSRCSWPAWAFTRWPGGPVIAAGWLFVAGTVLFSGSLYLLTLTGQRWLGAITPLGGLAFILGWAALAWAALRS